MVEREQKQLQLLLLIQHLSEQKRKISETMLPQLLQRLEQSADSAFDWAKSNGLLTESDVRKLDQQFRDVCADQSSSLHEATEQLLSGSPELQASHRLLASEAATADPMATEYESKPPESLVPTPNVDDGTEVEAAPSPDPNATADHTGADSPARGSTRVQSSGGVEEAKELSDPDQTHHRFRPLRFHARGGLGEIHIAQDEELNREVALKEIRPQYVDDQPSRDRFVMEGEVTGRLEHPGVVPVYGMGADASGRPFYAMRFIKGESLSDADRTFPWLEVWEKQRSRAP